MSSRFRRALKRYTLNISYCPERQSMAIPLHMDGWAEGEPARGAILRGYFLPAAESQSRSRLEPSTTGLACRMLAAFQSSQP